MDDLYAFLIVKTVWKALYSGTSAGKQTKTVDALPPFAVDDGIVKVEKTASRCGLAQQVNKSLASVVK